MTTSSSVLSQLRWQSVRNAEGVVLLEIENAELKKEISNLKKIISDGSSSNDFALNKYSKLLMQLNQLSGKRLSSLKSNIEAMRSEFSFQSYGFLSDFTKFKSILENLLNVLNQEVSENKRLKIEVEGLQLSLQRASYDLLNADTNASNSTKEMRLEIDLLKTKLSELKQNFISLEKENNVVKCENETYLTNSKRDKKLIEELERDCSRIQGDNRVLIDAMKNSQHEIELKLRQIYDEHEEAMNAIGLENLTAKIKISDQEEEIKQLKEAILGNKSQFGKYMDLKYENSQLHAKLNAKNIQNNNKNNNFQRIPNIVPNLNLNPNSINYPLPPSARRNVIDPSFSPPTSPRKPSARESNSTVNRPAIFLNKNSIEI